MEGFISSTLGLNASQIAITDLFVEPGTAISQASQTVKLRVDLTATPSADHTAATVRLTCPYAPSHDVWYLQETCSTLCGAGDSPTDPCCTAPETLTVVY